MPAWKWGPDNANLKLAVGAVEMTLSGSSAPGVPMVPGPGLLVFSGAVPGLDSFSALDFLTPQVRLVCQLKGVGGFSDLELPMSSCQIYIQNDAPNNIQVVVSDFSYAGDIADRAEGSLMVSKVSLGREGHRQYEEILTIPLTSIRTDEGARNKSITLEAREDG